MEKHVLVIFPHPDDEVFASGSMIQYSKLGIPVTYVCATLGEMGRNMGNPFYATRESLPLIRKKELEEATRLLGIKGLRLLGLRDKTLEFEDITHLSAQLLQIIQEVEPSLIITFYPGYSVHPDHDACGEAVIHAVKQIPEAYRPKVYLTATAKGAERQIGKPDILQDISDVLEEKIASLSAHRTQVEASRTGLGERLKRRDQATLNWLNPERFWIWRKK